MRRLIFAAMLISAVAYAGEPAGRAIFRIRVIDESQNGMIVPGYTRIGDELVLFETSDGDVSVYRYTKSGDPSHPPYESFQRFGASFAKEMFRNSGLQGFNFETQSAVAKATMNQRDPLRSLPHVIGGTTVEVFADYQSVRFSFRSKDLNAILPVLADYDPEMSRLLKLLIEVGAFRRTSYSFTQ